MINFYNVPLLLYSFWIQNSFSNTRLHPLIKPGSFCRLKQHMVTIHTKERNYTEKQSNLIRHSGDVVLLLVRPWLTICTYTKLTMDLHCFVWESKARTEEWRGFYFSDLHSFRQIFYCSINSFVHSSSPLNSIHPNPLLHCSYGRIKDGLCANLGLANIRKLEYCSAIIHNHRRRWEGLFLVLVVS